VDPRSRPLYANSDTHRYTRTDRPSLVADRPVRRINLQWDGACDASRTDGGASAAGTLLGRHRLDDQISVVGGIHRHCGKSERSLDQSADVGPVEIVG
jgi:hypothetical protein